MKLLNFSCFSKLLINLKYRLQTGMRGAFRKPQGTVARVNIGQPIMSIRSSDKVQGCCHRIPSPSQAQVPWSPKGILLVKEVKNVITYIAFFEIDLCLQEMGIHQI
jgi:hypothetical protein